MGLLGTFPGLSFPFPALTHGGAGQGRVDGVSG